MTTLSRTALLFVSGALLVTTVACSSATTPAPNSDSTEQDVKAASSSSCDPTSSSAPCAPTTPTDAGSSADASADADAATTCCDPAAKPDGYYPEGISCCADNGWHASLGGGASHTCAAHGGVGTVCEATPTETCGGPPMNAFCAACPGGINGYKQIDGQPTCDCCTSTNDGKTP